MLQQRLYRLSSPRPPSCSQLLRAGCSLFNGIPSVCTWEACPSALAMQTAWLWSHHAFPPLIPSITLSLLGSLSFRRTNHLNKILKMLKFSISEAKIWPSKGPKASNSPLVDFCRETPRGPNPWFHVFPPRPNSRGFTSKDVMRLQKRSTGTSVCV